MHQRENLGVNVSMVGPNFSSSDTIHQHTPLTQRHTQTVDPALIQEVFEVDRCHHWVTQGGYTRVCLQFPDYLLHEAPGVANLLQKKLGQDVYILGDTTYGACCVDEIAAAHCNADCVIHFGHTCLTKSRTLPVLYIFTRRSVDVESLAAAIIGLEQEVLLLYDVEYEHVLGPWDGGGAQVVKARCIPGVPLSSSVAGRSLPTMDTHSQSGKVVYVGRGEETLLNLVYSLPQHEFLHWKEDSLVGAGLAINKLLMRRYFLVEKARDATRVGILVGTLGMEGVTHCIDKLKQVVREAGKKVYTFLVGKPNVAKLANFPEIDVFIYVACPEVSFLDSRDFLQPVITPWEAEIACNRNLSWTGDYVTDFRHLLPGGKYHHCTEASHLQGEQGEGEEEADISLVTGNIRRLGTHTHQAGQGQLMVINDKTVSVVHQGGGGEYLAAREWAGLTPSLGKTEVKGVVQGSRGLAQGYCG